MSDLHLLLETFSQQPSSRNDESEVRSFLDFSEPIVLENYRIGSGFFLAGTGNDEAVENRLNQLQAENFRAGIFSAHLDEAAQRAFVLAPLVPHEADTITKRTKIISKLVRFLQRIGVSAPKVYLLNGSRRAWRSNSNHAVRVAREVEIVENWLLDQHNLESVVKDVDIDIAVGYADILVPFDGFSGYMLARTFATLCDDIRSHSVPWFSSSAACPFSKLDLPTGLTTIRGTVDSNKRLEQLGSHADGWIRLCEQYRRKGSMEAYET